MVAYSLRAASRCDGIERIVLVAPAGFGPALGDLKGLLDGPTARRLPIEVVAGGATRQASVRAGLAAVPRAAPAIVVHDAARPFASPELFSRVVAKILAAGDAPDGVVPALPCHDTVKRVREATIVETLLREELFLAQTPQAFDADALRRSHGLAVERSLEATDDAMLLEAAGYRVVVIPGEHANMKITTAEDLARAELHLGNEEDGRTGATIDHHA